MEMFRRYGGIWGVYGGIWGIWGIWGVWGYMLRERESERESRARSLPHLRAARRGVSVATTGTLSRVLGARTGAGQRLASERAASLSRQKKSGGNRAGSLGVRVGNERQRPRLAAPRWQQPHLRTGGGRNCEAEGGVAARAPNRSASHGGSGEGAAGCASEMRRAARACSSPRPYVRRYGGPARAERERRGTWRRRGEQTRRPGWRGTCRAVGCDQKERLRHYSLEVSRIL